MANEADQIFSTKRAIDFLIYGAPPQVTAQSRRTVASRGRLIDDPAEMEERLAPYRNEGRR